MKISRLALLFFTPLLWAQAPSSPRAAPDCCYFVASQSVALSSSAGVLTVQQPVFPSKDVQFVSAAVFSTVALNFTIERDGTAANTTLGFAQAVNPNQGASTLVEYTSSNVGTGKTVLPYAVAAGAWQPIDLSAFVFQQSQKGLNLSIRTASGTGNVILMITWKEYNQ